MLEYVDSFDDISTGGDIIVEVESRDKVYVSVVTDILDDEIDTSSKISVEVVDGECEFDAVAVNIEALSIIVEPSLTDVCISDMVVLVSVRVDVITVLITIVSLVDATVLLKIETELRSPAIVVNVCSCGLFDE